MNAIDRRRLLTLMFGAAAAATIGPGLHPQAAQAAPLPLAAGLSENSHDLVQRAQFVVVGPRRRRYWGRRRWGRRRWGYRRWGRRGRW